MRSNSLKRFNGYSFKEFMKEVMDARLMTISTLAKRVTKYVSRNTVYEILNGSREATIAQRNHLLREVGRTYITGPKYWTLRDGVWYFYDSSRKRRVNTTPQPKTQKVDGLSRSEWMKRRWASGVMDQYRSKMGVQSVAKIAPKTNEVTATAKSIYNIPVDTQQLSYKLISEQIRKVDDAVRNVNNIQVAVLIATIVGFIILMVLVG